MMLMRRTYQALGLGLLMATVTGCSLLLSFTGTFRFTFGPEGSRTTITATLTQVETMITGQMVFEGESGGMIDTETFNVSAVVRARGVANGTLQPVGTTIIMHPVLLLLSGNGQFLTVRLNDVGNFGYVLTRVAP